MSSQKVFTRPFLEISKEEIFVPKRRKFIMFSWFGNLFKADIDSVSTGHVLTADIAQKDGYDTYVANMVNSEGVLQEKVRDWWFNFLPSLKNKGIKRIISVESPEATALSKQANKAWEKSVSFHGLEIINAESMKDLKENIL